jgi:nucleoside-diphosphate-sugar epimerase
MVGNSQLEFELQSLDPSLNILLTGASGCIGHYVVEQLLAHTPHHLYVLVRNPDKLKVSCPTSDRLHWVEGNLQDLSCLSSVIPAIDWGILMATAWGDPTETYHINVTQTIALMEQLFQAKCQHIFYFSTASILDRSNQLLPQAGELGTDYIRTKYQCFQALERSSFAHRVTVFFPTLVFGGDAQKPISHLSSGLPEVMKWLWLIRFLRLDASFHFLHAYDIAQVIGGELEATRQKILSSTPLEPLCKVVLGNPAVTFQGAIEQCCAVKKLSRFPLGVPLSPWLADLIIWLFHIRVAAWDRFCLTYRHFTYQNPANPRQFQQQPYAETIADLLRE